MKMNEIMATIKVLASSQGFYSRLYHNLNMIQATDENRFNAITSELEKQNFKDSIDVIYFFEH